MNRVSVLAAVLPASLGLALAQAGLGSPLGETVLLVCRVLAVAVWLGALAAAMTGAERGGEARAKAGTLLLAVLGLVVLFGCVSALSAFGVSVEGQVALAAVVVAILLAWLSDRWRQPGLRTAAAVVAGLGMLGFLVGFTPARSLAPLIGAAGGGAVLLGQGLYAGWRVRR